ncbi:hypothetical protein [Bartonella bovis]|uniref:hypothetical protein n=1 Tax=Bartonella bovis TaxID=155194 RepID=UPI0003A32306|nr:hypothetical protein [Bartonella bovis]
MNDIHDSLDVNTTFHQLEKDKDVFACYKNASGSNKVVTVSVDLHKVMRLAV